MVKPNAILLVGRQENIDTVVDLIQKLDQPVAPETQIKVFRLLHMSAVNAETYIRNFYGAAGRTTDGRRHSKPSRPRAGSSPRVTVIGDYRSNSLIVQASPRDLVEVAKLLEELDVEKTDASVEVRVFALKNSVASTMQTVLQNTLAMQQQQGTTGMQGGFQPTQALGAGPDSGAELDVAEHPDHRHRSGREQDHRVRIAHRRDGHGRRQLEHHWSSRRPRRAWD